MEDELDCQVSANVGPRWGGAARIGLMVRSRPGCRPGGTEAGKWWWLHSTSLYLTLLYCTQHYRGGAGCCGGGDDSQREARSSGAMASGGLRLASSGPQHIIGWGLKTFHQDPR